MNEKYKYNKQSNKIDKTLYKSDEKVYKIDIKMGICIIVICYELKA